MSTYIDPSALIPLYLLGSDTSMAASAVQSSAPPVPLNLLQELEVRNAIYLKVALQEITQSQADRAIQHFDADIAAGRFIRVNLNWNAVFDEAAAISRLLVPSNKCRTLDILHLAAANFSQVDGFVSLLPFQVTMGGAANEYKEQRDRGTQSKPSE